MRIAVLLHGQPRHLEQGAWWFKNKVFPKHFKNIQVDYFGAFWNDGTPDLRQRIESTYNPIRYHVFNYEEYWQKFYNECNEYHNNNDISNFLPGHIRHNVLCVDDIHNVSKFQKNFWGQFISAGLVTNLTGNLSGEYDIVIRTRTDVAFKPMSEKLWVDTFNNMNTNPTFVDKIFADWMHVQHGRGLLGDFAFFAKPHVWYDFAKNIYNDCISIATENCLLWYDETLEKEKSTLFPHKAWTNLSVVSHTDWLSFHVVWPSPYASTLIRGDYNIQEETFDTLVQKFWDHQASR